MKITRKGIALFLSVAILGTSPTVFADEPSTATTNRDTTTISVELNSIEKKQVNEEQKEIVENIKKMNKNSETFSTQLDKLVDEKYIVIDEAIEEKAEEKNISIDNLSDVDTNIMDKTYNINDGVAVTFEDTTVSVDIVEENERVASLAEEKEFKDEVDDDQNPLNNPIAFLESCFVTPVHAASKTKIKEVEYKKYVTDKAIKAWKTGIFYIACEFTYNGTKVTARRTGDYIKPKGVVSNILYSTVGEKSAVQKPSSKRRIAYVSGTLKGGIQVKGYGLIIDRYWGRAEIECNHKGQITKRFKHS